MYQKWEEEPAMLEATQPTIEKHSATNAEREAHEAAITATSVTATTLLPGICMLQCVAVCTSVLRCVSVCS